MLPEHEDLMHSVVGLLYERLTGGDGSVVDEHPAFFAWCAPGIPISDDQFDFMAGFRSSASDENERLAAEERLAALAADFASIVDFIPTTSGIYSSEDQHAVVANRQGRLSSEWERTLRMSQVADEPLSDEQRERLDRFRGLLQTTRIDEDLITGDKREVADDSDLVKIYNEKMADYESAVLAFNGARLAGGREFMINGPILSRRVRAANDDWAAAGRRDEVDQMRAYISQVTGRSMVSHKQRLIERFEMAKLADVRGGEFLFTGAAPATVLRSSGWTRLSFGTEQLRQADSKATNRWGAQGRGGPLGSLTGSAEVSSERTTIDSSIDTTNFKLSFEITQVPIMRPWLAPEFLESRGWRFAGGGSLLSDGKKPPQEGTLPAYPETLILVRDLELELAELSKSSSELRRQFEAKGGVGWGPFKLSGEYAREREDERMESEASEQGIRVDGTQIVGFRCHELPRSPDPDPDIPEEHWVT